MKMPYKGRKCVKIVQKMDIKRNYSRKCVENVQKTIKKCIYSSNIGQFYAKNDQKKHIWGNNCRKIGKKLSLFQAKTHIRGKLMDNFAQKCFPPGTATLSHPGHKNRQKKMQKRIYGENILEKDAKKCQKLSKKRI